jgi:hypothetical protein
MVKKGLCHGASRDSSFSLCSVALSAVLALVTHSLLLTTSWIYFFGSIQLGEVSSLFSFLSLPTICNNVLINCTRTRHNVPATKGVRV